MSVDAVKVDLPTIAYVDESKDERDNFYGDAYETGYFAEIHLLGPENDLKSLVDKLIELDIDALVSDFNLSDDRPNPYNGADVVEAFLARRHNFPCFIRTSFDQDAMGSSSDVNRVYSKNSPEELAVGRDLFRRISLQVDHHRKKIEELGHEYDELIAIPPADRSAGQIDRLVELDDALEQSFAADQNFTTTAKRELLDRNGLFAKQGELVEQTKKLILAMKQKLGD